MALHVSSPRFLQRVSSSYIEGCVTAHITAGKMPRFNLTAAPIFSIWCGEVIIMHQTTKNFQVQEVEIYLAIDKVLIPSINRAGFSPSCPRTVHSELTSDPAERKPLLTHGSA